MKSFGKKSKDEMVKSLKILKTGLAQETVETKEMLDVYMKFTQNKASKEDMEKANKQFRDLLRTMGLGFFAVLPFAPVTIPLLVKLGRRLGIEILPSSFAERNDEK